MSRTGEGGLGAIKKIPFAMAKFLLTKNVCLVDTIVFRH